MMFQQTIVVIRVNENIPYFNSHCLNVSHCHGEQSLFLMNCFCIQTTKFLLLIIIIIITIFLIIITNSVPHEIAVKWYEMIQTGLPMCALSSFVAPIRLTGR